MFQRHLSVFALLLLPVSALAEDVVISDAYIRVSGPMAKAAAAFMVIENNTDEDIKLTSASSDAARMTELHTHVFEGDVAKMRPIEGGIEIAAGESHVLKRGEDHVMLMGLTDRLEDGEVVEIVLDFDSKHTVTAQIPVDNKREAEKAGH